MEPVISDEKTLDVLASSIKGDPSTEHEAWLKSEIEATLAKKKAGKMAYRSLDDVMNKFGFNAR